MTKKLPRWLVSRCLLANSTTPYLLDHVSGHNERLPLLDPKGPMGEEKIRTWNGSDTALRSNGGRASSVVGRVSPVTTSRKHTITPKGPLIMMLKFTWILCCCCKAGKFVCPMVFKCSPFSAVLRKKKRIFSFAFYDKIRVEFDFI